MRERIENDGKEKKKCCVGDHKLLTFDNASSCQ